MKPTLFRGVCRKCQAEVAQVRYKSGKSSPPFDVYSPERNEYTRHVCDPTKKSEREKYLAEWKTRMQRYKARMDRLYKQARKRECPRCNQPVGADCLDLRKRTPASRSQPHDERIEGLI